MAHFPPQRGGFAPGGGSAPVRAFDGKASIMTQNRQAKESDNMNLHAKTFSAWMNVHLRKRELAVTNLAQDLSDGILLIQLIEILSGQTCPTYNKNPKLDIQKVENVSIALTFINQFTKINVAPKDIVSGNLKVILSVIWRLIINFQVTTSSSGAPAQSQSSLALKKEARQRLMAWVQEKTGIPIRDCDRSFDDGLIFCKLIYAFDPNLINVQQVQQQSPAQNLAMAFDIIEKHLHIPKMLYVEDMINPDISARPDEQCVITYLSHFPECFVAHRQTPSYLSPDAVEIQLPNTGAYSSVAAAPVTQQAPLPTAAPAKPRYTLGGNLPSMPSVSTGAFREPAPVAAPAVPTNTAPVGVAPHSPVPVNNQYFAEPSSSPYASFNNNAPYNNPALASGVNSQLSGGNNNLSNPNPQVPAGYTSQTSYQPNQHADHTAQASGYSSQYGAPGSNAALSNPNMTQNQGGAPGSFPNAYASAYTAHTAGSTPAAAYATQPTRPPPPSTDFAPVAVPQRPPPPTSAFQSFSGGSPYGSGMSNDPMAADLLKKEQELRQKEEEFKRRELEFERMKAAHEEELRQLQLAEQTQSSAEDIERLQSKLQTLQKNSVAKLKVEVTSARTLMSLSILGSCSPYAVVTVDKQKEKTTTAKKTINPIWDAEFFFYVDDRNWTLNVTIYDKSKLGHDEFLGKVEIPIKQLKENVYKKQWFTLQPKKPGGSVSGEIQLGFLLSVDITKVR